MVALNNVHVHFPEKRLLAGKDGVRAAHKGFHQLSPAGGRGIDSDYKFLYLPAVLVFKRLHQRHVPVSGKPVGVVNIIKFIVVYLHILVHHGKLPKQLPVGLPVPYSLHKAFFQTLRFASSPSLSPGKGFQIRLYPLA